MDIKINHKMKNNEQTINKCGGRRGCSLDEYIIPNGILDKHYIGESIQISEYVHGSGNDISQVSTMVVIPLEKIRKKEKVQEKEAA